MRFRQCITLLAALLLARSQQAQFMQQDLSGPTDATRRVCLSRTPDGGEIIGGADDLGAVIIRIAPSDEIAWAQRYAQIDNVIDIGTFPEGDHYALAVHEVIDDVPELVILQLDTNGAVNWSRLLTYPLGTGMYSKYNYSNITHDENGDLILSPTTFDDTFILRLSRSGDLKWSVRYDRTTDLADYGAISSVHRGGTPGLAGTVYTVAAAGDDFGSLWLIATDTTGQCIWDRVYDMPLPLLPIPRDLLVTSDKRLVVVGELPEDMGAEYAFVLITDSLGDLLGPVRKIPSGVHRQQAFELADGSLAITGVMSYGSDSRGIAARYDTTGVFLSVKWGVIGYDQRYAIGPDGSFSAVTISPPSMGFADGARQTRGDLYGQIACGEDSIELTTSPVIPGERDGHTQVVGPEPVPVLVTGSPIAIAVLPFCGMAAVTEDPVFNALSVQPVPASDRITVQGWTGDQGPYTCTIVDVSGQEMLHVPMDPSMRQLDIDVGSLPQGSYLLLMAGPRDRCVARFAIMR